MGKYHESIIESNYVLGNYDIDDKELAQIYLNLGYAYAGLKQYEMAGTYFNKSCETAETVYKRGYGIVFC